MRSLARSLAAPLAATLLIAAAWLPRAAAGAKNYVCPPCGSPCDTTVFAAPGNCPVCGMALVEQGSAAAAPDPDQKKVAILVYDACEVLDFSGPYEMFGAAGCNVYTVAATKAPITTSMGLTVVPRYTFADAPPPDVLVIPGGGVQAAAKDSSTLAYIRKTTAGTKHTMSVCNGAFILANTGLLDGLSATTTYHNLTPLAQAYPKIKVIRDQRYVDNGKLITTGGLSAGMDGALHVIAKLFGTGYAQQVALGEEYDWHATATFARGALADRQVPELGLDSLGTWEIQSTDGDTTHWNVVAHGKLKVSSEELAKHIEGALTAGKWTPVGGPATSGATRKSNWKFTGTDGKPWTATLTLEGGADSAREVKASLNLARVG